MIRSLLLASVSLSCVVNDPKSTSTPTCDLAEINHFHRHGCEAFTQVIVWDWSHDYGRMHCQAFKLIDEWRTKPDGTLELRTHGSKPISLRPGRVVETWTDYDPERDNQRVFPVKFRRKVWP